MGWRRWSRQWQPLAAVLAVVAAAVLIGWMSFIHWHPSATDYPYQGPDVSEAQGIIDWAVVRGDGARFGYARATYGARGRDSRFDANWHAMHEAGIERGAYLTYSLCQLAADQANNFNTVVPRTADALPPAVLVDFDPACTARPERAVVVGEVARLMAMIENHVGKPAILKVSRRFDAAYQLSAAIPRPIWVIGNFLAPDYPAKPWRLWQANDRRRIDGAEKPVDWNVVAR